MEHELSVKDLLDALEKGESRVNSYWNFYMIVVIASVGWLMSKAQPFTIMQSVALTVALAAFFAGSLFVIRAATSRIVALESELKAQSANGSFASDVLRANLTRPPRFARLPISYFMHGTIDAAVIFAVWSKLS